MQSNNMPIAYTRHGTTKLFVALGVALLLLIAFLLPIRNDFQKINSGSSWSFRKLLVEDTEIRNVYVKRSAWVSEHQVPYKNNFQEYPPLGVLYISLPGIFTTS